MIITKEHRKILARQTGLDILATGRKTQTDLSRLKHWRILNAYALVYICEGNGSFESNETAESSVSAGDCFFLFPGISHYYGPPPGKVWKEIWVIFRGPLPDRMLKQKALDPAHPIVHLPGTRRSEFQRNLENLADTVKQRNFDFRVKSAALLYHCLLQSFLPLEDKATDDTDILREMKEILHSNIGNERKISEFFLTSRLSYNSLRMEFQRLTGQSPGQYLNEIRMQQAEEQLLWSDLNVNEICRGLGYTDSRYFSRAFKKHSGRSPREYRKRYYLIR